MKSLPDTWPALVKAYAQYRSMPVWGTMKRVPNRKGRLRRQDIDAITQRGKAAVARVQKAIDKFAVRCVSDWPTTPQALIGNQALLDSLRRHARPGEQILRNFFDALIFERDHYTCRYCGRDAFAFFESNERQRTIWLVVDHQDARIKGSPDIKVGRSPGRSDQELCDLGRNRLIHGFFWDLPEQYFLASVDGRLRRPRSGWGACSAAAKSRRKVFNLWLLLDDRWAGDTAQVEPVR